MDPTTVKTNAKKPVADFKTAQSESVKKFGKLVAARFTIVPALLFEKQRELNIDATELAIILQLMSFWWKAASLPWPSKRELATRLDMDQSTVRRHITTLCGKGIIKRIERSDQVTRRQKSNEYSFEPLVKKLKQIAKEAQKKKAKEQAQQDVDF